MKVRITGGSLKRTDGGSKSSSISCVQGDRYVMKAKKRLREMNSLARENLKSMYAWLSFGPNYCTHSIHPTFQLPSSTRQCERHLSSPNHSLAKPHKAQDRTARAPEPTPMQDQSQEPIHRTKQWPFYPFCNCSVRVGHKGGSKRPLGVISAADWRITTLALPTPDIHNDSCPVDRSTTARD